MRRVNARGGARKGHRSGRLWRLETLESRLLLSGQGLNEEPLLHLDAGITQHAQAADVAAAETSPAGATTASTAAPIGQLMAATMASSSVPALNSLPGAAITLYLDFNGDYQSQWGSYGSVTTPAFDQDGDPSSFSDSELATIRQIWQYVAEDYAPFQVNVTTVAPTSFANGSAVRVAIGGDGSWLGGGNGGISYIDSFSNSMPNTVFVFSENLGNGNARYVGDAASHEAGHAFGLLHQSEYDANGSKIEDYSTGPGDGRAPLMGDSYAATRSLWWNGTSGTSATSYQDDMAVLGQVLKYRPDDYTNTLATATPLAVSGGQFSRSGLISGTRDADLFSFTTGAGQVSLAVDVPANVQNLDARLQLLNANGTVLVTADPSNSFGASITRTLAAGTYYLRVTSHGNYGDVGTYTVHGAVVGASAIATLPATPTNLIATIASSHRVDLAWQDRATNETGFRVERYSRQDGRWVTIGGTAANVTRFSDTTVVGGRTYYYRIRAVNTAGSSAYAYVGQTNLAAALRPQVASAASTQTSAGTASQDGIGFAADVTQQTTAPGTGHTHRRWRTSQSPSQAAFADHAWLDRLRFDWS